jgi:hypothetical protein
MMPYTAATALCATLPLRLISAHPCLTQTLPTLSTQHVLCLFPLACTCSRPSIVSSTEFEADKESLLRMLSEFMRDHPEVSTTAAAAAGTAAASPAAAASSSSSSSVAGPVEGLLDSDAVNRGMAVVMACYEKDLKQPIRSLVSGELAHTLLIQVGQCYIGCYVCVMSNVLLYAGAWCLGSWHAHC